MKLREHYMKEEKVGNNSNREPATGYELGLGSVIFVSLFPTYCDPGSGCCGPCLVPKARYASGAFWNLDSMLCPGSLLVPSRHWIIQVKIWRAEPLAKRPTSGRDGMRGEHVSERLAAGPHAEVLYTGDQGCPYL